MPFNDLSNFGRLLEMPLINCKVKLKFTSIKYCVLSTNGNNSDNDNANADNIILTTTDTKLYVPVVLLPAGDKQLSKLLSKGFKRSVSWNEYKRKSEIKNTTAEYGYFLESNFVRVNRLSDLILFRSRCQF